MRLTERKEIYPTCDDKGNVTKVEFIGVKDIGLARDKLYQLENIEEELGIDLIILIKALENGIYHNQYCGVSSEPWHFQVDLKKKRFYYEIEDMGASWDLICRFKDYGKTWSLRKKDLKK